MILLAIGVAAFACVHLSTAVPAVEAVWQRKLGHRFRPVFGAILLICLALVVLGWRWSPYVPVYEPPAWGRYAAFVLVLIAFICVGVFLFRGALRQKLRFPLAIGLILWGVGHLLANGDLASLILFGGFILYATFHIGLGTVNGIRPSPIVRGGHDVLSILAGFALFGLMTQLHPVLIGVPVVDVGVPAAPG
jgi:uncharacterized membrane protein